MNVAGDGMLSTLGSMSSRKEYYVALARERGAKSAANEERTKTVHLQHGRNAEEQLRRLEHKQETLLERMESNSLLQADVQFSGQALRQTLLHAVLMLIRVLVPDQVCHALALYA